MSPSTQREKKVVGPTPKDLMKGARAKVTISIPGLYFDHSIAANLQAAHVVSYLIPELITKLAEYPEAIEFLRCPTAAWHLEKFSGDNISPSATLAEAGVKDGDTLYLVPTEPGEKFQEIIDDPAVALGYHQKQDFPGWSPPLSKKVALATLQAVSLVVGTILVGWMSTREVPLVTRMSVVGALSGMALLFLVLSVIAGRSTDKKRLMVAGPFSIITYVLGVSAGFVSIPREVSIYQFMVSGCVMLVLSLVIGAMSDKTPSIHYAAATSAAILLLVGGVYLLYATNPLVFGAQLAVAGFAVALYAPRLSMSFARFYIPWVPTTGQRFVDKEVKDMVHTSESENQSAISSVMNQKIKIAASHGIISGILTGTLAAVVSGMFLMGLYGGYRPWIVWAMAFILSVVLFSRGSSYDDAQQRVLITMSGAGGATMFLVGMAMSHTDTHPEARLFAGLIVLSLVACLSAVISLQQRTFMSPLAQGNMERVEHILYATIVPLLIVFIMDLATKIRSR